MNWNSVSVTGIKSLYDFNEIHIADSIDIRNDETNESDFEILSDISQNEPVIEFSKSGSSVYNTVNNSDKCYFSGVGSYYARTGNSDGSFYRIVDKKVFLLIP